MTDAVPRLNLAPKLNRPLQLWNPLDYLRLLYWVFYFPQALRWYEGTFVSLEHRGAKGKALWQAFMQDAVLRNLILQALLLLFAAPALTWAMQQYGLSIDWTGVALGIALGVTLSVAGSIAVGVAESLACGVAFGVLLGVAGSVALGVDFGVVVGVLSGLAINTALGVDLGVARSVAVCVALSVAVGVAYGVAYGVAVGVAYGLVVGVAVGVAVLRPDAWAIATFFSLLSRPEFMAANTALPLPGLGRRLKDWLGRDWPAGVHNLNELLAYSMQFNPAVSALNDSLAELPSERLLPMVDEVARAPFDWKMLLYSSAPFESKMKAEAIEGVVFFPSSWKKRLKARYPINPRLDTPARAACAGFYLLHEKQPLQAAQAFAAVRSLPNGQEMHNISQALHLAQSSRGFQDLVDLSGQEDFLQATTRPSEPMLLHPETWEALGHLQLCAQEAQVVQKSASKASRSWALNRAIGEVVAVQKMVSTVPLAERTLVEEIAKIWQSILVSESAEVGSIPISEPVKNPYVAGDPVVGAGLKGRDDILMDLKQLWSGTTQPPSVVLYGHRRMGKTSILRNINSYLGSEVRLAYVNLLILGGAERGLSDLFLAIADEIRASLPELPEAKMDEFDRHPELAFKQYLDLAQSALGSSRLIIALDEFEKLEEWMNAGKIPGDLLDTFRGYIQKDQNIAFAFAGLHKLEEMTEDYFNPLFASVRPIPVSFLSKEATLQVLANPPLQDFPLDFSEEALERIWQLTGGQPYLVQLVGHYLVSRFNRLTFEQGKPMEPVFIFSDVEAVIEDPEFYSQGRYYFAGIWGQAGQGAEGQQEMLKFVAAFPDGISFEEIVARFGPDTDRLTAALNELERHDVLREKDGQWQFTVELMRRWVKEFSDN